MRRIVVTGFISVFLLVSIAQAQVTQLGRMPSRGPVRQAGLLSNLLHPAATICDECPEPACGVVGPTCGLAGTILAGPGCGVPEPRCGSTGLGYAGGFGLCGDCDSCGIGGYVGRNLHRVNPCACGGSLIGDLARGLLTLVDRAVGTVATHVFGGLRVVTCHASGTFAALQCAAQAHCYHCGGLGCDDCGVPMGSYDGYDGGHTIMMDPVQPMPVPDENVDPFVDDPEPQAHQPRPLRRDYSSRAVPSHRSFPARSLIQRSASPVRTAAAQTLAPVRGRYLQSQTYSRRPTIRR